MRLFSMKLFGAALLLVLSACQTTDTVSEKSAPPVAAKADSVFANHFEGKTYKGKWFFGGTNKPVSVTATDDTMIVRGEDYDGSSYSYSGAYTVTGENTATMKTRMGSGANRTLSIKLTDDRFYASIKDDGVRSRGDINAVDSALLVEDPAPVAEADPVATVVAAMNGKFHCEYERSNNSFDLHLGSHSNDSGSLLSDVGRGTWKVTKNADGTTSWTRMINSSYETQPISVESDGTIVIETGRSEDGDVRCTKRS